MTDRRLIAFVFGAGLAAAPVPGFADAIQLIRGSDGNFISDTAVRIEAAPDQPNPAPAPVDAYTDQLGRFIVNLPSGKYRATAVVGGQPHTFDLQIDGQSQMKIYALPF